jgi:Uma2 family endonuclease
MTEKRSSAYRKSPSEEPISIEEYVRIPDDGYPTELVRGRLVREPQPGYIHARLQVEIAYRLKSFIERHALDLDCVGPVGVITEEHPDTVRGPDVVVVRRSHAAALGRADFLQGGPALAVEVLSPSNRVGEMAEKVREYLAAGAALVWVIDPRKRTVVVQRGPSERSTLVDDDVLDGGDVLPGLRISLRDLFRDQT